MAAEIRVRVVLTDGARSVDEAYVIRKGFDFYYGRTKGHEQHAYHASGQHHVKDVSSGKKKRVGRYIPPEELNGPHGLITWAVPNWPNRMQFPDTERDYTGKKADHVINLDVRSVPEDACINILLGLVAPSALAGLGRGSSSKFVCHELHVATCDPPWIFVELGWTPPRVLEDGIVSSVTLWRWEEPPEPT